MTPLILAAAAAISSCHPVSTYVELTQAVAKEVKIYRLSKAETTRIIHAMADLGVLTDKWVIPPYKAVGSLYFDDPVSPGFNSVAPIYPGAIACQTIHVPQSIIDEARTP